MDYNKLMKTSIVLMEHHRGKTLDARTIQSAVRLIYMDNPILNSLITNGTKYACVANANSDYKKKITNWTTNKQAISEFMKTQAPDITTTNYIISDVAISYLTGVVDTLNNQVQPFN